jgi:hypothetical protein
MPAYEYRLARRGLAVEPISEEAEHKDTRIYFVACGRARHGARAARGSREMPSQHNESGGLFACKLNGCGMGCGIAAGVGPRVPRTYTALEGGSPERKTV